MARETQDREDLLAEATALVERVELAIAGEPKPIVAGFRRDGCLSLFFGADPVYQFNTSNELRRAYVGGKLYKAEKGKLIALDRRREANAIYLVRQPLDDGETREFLRQLTAQLRHLATAVLDGHYAVLRQVPPQAAVIGRVQDWLTENTGAVQVATSPHAK